MKNIKVEEFTTPILHVISENALLDQAFSIMKENNIRHLPVSDGEQILGIISERDVMALYGKGWQEAIRVRDFMNESVLSVYRGDNLGEVAYQLSNNKVGSAIVLDENGKVYGIFTVTDALNALVEIFVTDAYERSDLR
ncbi:CBS domain-containing protein [Halobacteriovorax vibrionivorans]|uniref:CBS domain-containing protein n=1 Tax=Halobacteriovorax vibrionivorans TaxID=2152716 RepID=A0ABY0IGY6_9BACT|nr:CBS domain-containing protein [Halobacteriovorax vibrionivorans]RZF22193.1 CBS domain-containing protein [Halobacteriovorax vibrionivorans]